MRAPAFSRQANPNTAKIRIDLHALTTALAAHDGSRVLDLRGPATPRAR